MTTHSNKDTRTELILRIHFFWRILFALLSAAGAIAPWAGYTGIESLWQKILVTILLSVAAVFSAIGARQIHFRDHSGRMISLGLDYLAFFASAVFVLNIGEVFLGIDALGENFSKGIPYLGIVFAGYLLSILDDYFPQKNRTSESSLKRVGRWVALAGFILFLWNVNAVNGFLYFLGKLPNPTVSSPWRVLCYFQPPSGPCGVNPARRLFPQRRGTNRS
jgi:hypothetical protein